MAVIKSEEITERDNTPGQKRDVGLLGSRNRVIKGTFDFNVTNLPQADALLMCTLPVQARVHVIRYRSKGVNASNTHPGLYDRAGNAVNVTAYANDNAISGFGDEGTDLAFEERSIDKIQDQVWQDAGLSADPTKDPMANVADFTLGLRANSAAITQGKLSWEVEYSID